MAHNTEHEIVPFISNRAKKHVDKVVALYKKAKEEMESTR